MTNFSTLIKFCFLAAILFAVESKKKKSRWEMTQEKPSPPHEGFYKIGDMEFPINHHNETRAAFYRDYRWPFAQVPLVIEEGMSVEQSNNIIEGFMNIQKETCLQFFQKSNQNYYLYFYMKNDGSTDCSASVGYRGNAPVNRDEKHFVGIGKYGCPVNAISHEIMHALGFSHEQNRNDRDKYIKINWDNIDREAASTSDPTGNFKMDRDHGYGETKTYDLPYNYESIMHYGPFFYSKKYNVPGYETMEAIPDSGAIGDPKKMGDDNNPISETDYELIRKHYNCVRKGDGWVQQPDDMRPEKENEDDDKEEEDKGKGKNKGMELTFKFRQL